MKHFTFVSYAFHGQPKEYQGVTLGRDQLVGGAEIYLFDLATMLIRLGHHVTVIQSGADAREYDWEGIHIKQIHFQWAGQRLGLPEQWWGFNRHWLHALPPDTDHVHLHYLHHAWPAATSDMTATCHGITWDIPYDQSVRLQMQRYPLLLKLLQPLTYFGYIKGEEFLASQGLQRVGRIASVDTALVRFAERRVPATTKKITYIPNYVQQGLFHPATTQSKNDQRLKGRRVILYPRMLSFNRGAHLLMPALGEIVKRFPDVLMVLAGSGNASEYVHEQVTGLNLQHHVLFLGHVDHRHDMPRHFQDADVVIIPSIGSEGTSLSCLEAMATGKPIVASRVGGLPDLIQHERNGLLITPTSANLALAINRLLANPSEAHTMGLTALEDTKQLYSQERWERSYQQFFNLDSVQRS